MILALITLEHVGADEVTFSEAQRVNMDNSSEYFLVQETGVYEIRLQGQLASGYTEWFVGFEIIIGPEEIVLHGEITDQAALHGLLRRVRDLGIPLISVIRIPISLKRGNT